MSRISKAYIRKNGVWNPFEMILWVKEGSAYPDVDPKDPEYGETVSKLVMISTEYDGHRQVITDARYNYFKKCWELLIDSTVGYYEKIIPGMNVEYWAYYPKPVEPEDVK